MASVNEKLLEKQLRNNMAISGGHFMIQEDGTANLNQGTIDSFKESVKMYATAKNKQWNVQLILLINNMGAVCDTKKNVCMIDPEELKSNFSLPKEYNQILKEFNISQGEVKIYWEKNLRNRGKKELLKKVKEEDKNIELKEGAYWFINPDDGRKITLSRPNPNDKYGIPACPLIMTAFADKIRKEGYETSLHFYYVDLENEDNIPNYFAIEKGRIVAESFYNDLNIMNIYLLKDRVVTSFQMGKK